MKMHQHSAITNRVVASIGCKQVLDKRDCASESEARVRPLPFCKPFLPGADQSEDLSHAATMFANDASALQLLVGLSAPFRIHGATSAFFDMFQLSAATCISRSLGLVQGPETDVKLLFSLFETARVGKGANAMIMFYSSSGNGHLFHVAVEPQSSQCDAPESCIISLELVQATPLKDAVLPDGRAKVIVSADRDSRTVHVSPEFEKMYGYLWSEIAGRTLGFITGPNTNMALLRKLLNRARYGHSDSSLFFTNTATGEELLTVIQVKPVVDGGVVSHMVLVCSIVGDIAGHCLHAQTNDGEWGKDPVFDELHVANFIDPVEDLTSSVDSLAHSRAHMHLEHSKETVAASQAPYTLPSRACAQGGDSQTVCDFRPNTWGRHSSADSAPVKPSLLTKRAHDDMEWRPDLLHLDQQRNMPSRQRAKIMATSEIFEVLCKQVEEERTQEVGLSQSLHSFHVGLPQDSRLTLPQRHALRDTSAPCAHIAHKEPIQQKEATAHVLAPATSATHAGAAAGAVHTTVAAARPPVEAVAAAGSPSSSAGVEGQVIVQPRRRKAGQDCSEADATVVLTKEVLEKYWSMPLSTAARMIGISTTAMKKACRRLDVNRWPYSSRTTTAQMSAKRNVSVDTALGQYVGRLQRKYSQRLRKEALKSSTSACRGATGGGEGAAAAAAVAVMRS